ncbi:g patch domain containing protein 1 [Stemphylium lycopersici]|nr:g patch domain containing protein 1 [Stemphylium lycopersici]
MAYKRPRPASPTNAHKRSRGGPSTYIALGTGLPEEEADDGAFVPVWKQTVTDERGRRRLHGAFTGGFSAGYFNTVGSKEGWTPKTFVSSRTNRNKDQPTGQAQRAEDFMDEEDLAAAVESRQLETAQNFAGIGESGQASDNGLFGLFMTQEETMGVKLAQKMGWRRDQGIGRKVRRNADLEDGTASSNWDSAHLFAPQDARTMTMPPEEVRRKGLGYASEARLGVAEDDAEDLSSKFQLHYLEGPSKAPAVKKPVAKKSSFGVGVLNDTGSDDDDPYELGPKITFNKTMGKEKKGKKLSKFAKPGAGEKHVFVSKKNSSKALVSTSRPPINGKSPLKGFTFGTGLADVTSKPKYPPPKIPSGWKSSKSAASTSESKAYQSVADAAKASTLDAKGRSALLGEKPLPGKSIFDFIPKDARDRLAALSGKADLPQGLGEAGPDGHLPANKAQVKDLWSLVPALEKSLAASALAKGATGWMPYAEDLQKRTRYVGFLQLRAELKNDLPDRPNGVSVSEWVKELQEFAHAAQVFKPTTGIMASRFTSSSSSTTGGGDGNGAATDNLLRQPTAKPEDPAESAAKLGMYGPMTRSSFAFHPSRLLCKRFNVKPPPDMPPEFDDAETSFKPQTEEAVSKSAMDRLQHEFLTNGPALQRPAWMGQAADASATPATATAATTTAVPQTEHATVDVEKNEALSNERASEDVFKAIFGDDDEDE